MRLCPLTASCESMRRVTRIPPSPTMTAKTNPHVEISGTGILKPTRYAACASKKATSPAINNRSSEIINSTSPVSDNRIPSPNQSGAPLRPVDVHSQRNRVIITAGLARYSKRAHFFHKASDSSAANTSAAIRNMFAMCSCFKSYHNF